MTAPQVAGLTPEERGELEELFATWEAKLIRNRLRMKYYNGKAGLKDLGITIPPTLTRVDMVCGWPAKAVDALAVRSAFDGFVFAEEVEDDLSATLLANNFKNLYSQAVNSELIHSCSFATVTKGAPDEPVVQIGFYSALNAAALWDSRKKRIKCGFTVVSLDKDGNPDWINMYTDDYVLQMTARDKYWSLERLEHAQGRPLMEPLVYRPSLDRPFGKSRISRAVMSIADSAVREMLRTEVHAEIYAVPQKYLIGLDLSAEDKQKISNFINTYFYATRDENGNLPEFGQLPQASMDPHINYMRSLAAQFAGETGMPISSLGVIHDNPASAEAIYAAKEDLIIEAEALNETNGQSLHNIGLLALAIAKDTTVDKLTDAEKSIMPKFRPVDKPSVASQADAMMKQVSAAPWIANTTVFLEELGYNDEQITRMQNERRRAEGQKTFEEIIKATPQEQAKPVEQDTGESEGEASGEEA
jgi:hypothetical protein